MTKVFLFYIFTLFSPIIYSQSKEKLSNKEKEIDTTQYVQYYIIEGDTIPHEAINLDEVIILGKLNFEDKLARRKYLILRRKTQKVYPYAKLAADRLISLNERLQKIQSKREKRKYIRILQRYMEDEFTSELKKMTRTEGQILVKLIHRQTGRTMFDLVKEYRSGFRAFSYNVTASFFDISLKEEYNPIEVQEDYWIEDILQRSFQANILEEQRTALDFSFYDLRDKWSKSSETNNPKT